MPDSWTQARSRLARLSQTHAPDSPEILAARRDLRVARLADYISKVVDQAPPLLPEQRDRLALLLRGPSDAKGATTSEAAAS